VLEFADKVAIITGAGRGFGKAFGFALGGLGARIAVVDIDPSAADAAAAEMRAAGIEALAIPCDVADEALVAGMVERTVEKFGGIDILINNAGLHSAAYNEPMAKSGITKLRRLFDVNVMGTIICSLACQPQMAGREKAAIINISSMASYGCNTAYGVSKLAVRGLTASLAHEFAGSGIRVNAIAPGLIFTETIRAELPEALVQRVFDTQILKRRGEERDIVEAMLYLCSDRASFVTGETLRVSGGATLQL